MKPELDSSLSETDQIQHFQYRKGVVPEWCRFAHIRCSTTDSSVRSWCRRLFQTDEVELCSRPGERCTGLSPGVLECTDCVVAAAFPVLGDRPNLNEMIPARIDTPPEMASAMLVLHQDLADEESRIRAGEIDTGSLGRLAAETERFATALRRFGWLAARR